MTDTRTIAAGKALQHTVIGNQQGNQLVNVGRAPHSGLESERVVVRENLRCEVNTYTGDNVRKIAAYDNTEYDNRILRVAAYCRVSTDDIDQVISIEMQKNVYRDMIKGNPKWKYAGTYVDDGFSGTNTEHRPAFRLMMRDAMAGKIDMIITKSVSRFARNLLDCIGWVRKLQEHEPPVPVFFEQENLNTLASTSNIILFVLAMVAEEESHMKSEAMLLSLEWRLSRGRFLMPKLLGYDKVIVEEASGIKRSKLVINESQAQTVKLMYYMLLSGCGLSEIADTLTELVRETGGKRKDKTPNTQWTPHGITAVMRNERYCGDVLARKTWTPNFHDHKSIRNRGKKNKYYQPDHHEAIVTRAQWNAAQKILNSQRYAHSGGYLPMSVIDHGALCGFISMNPSWAGYEPDEYYRVCSIAMKHEGGELNIDLDNEHMPDRGYRVAGMTDDNGVQRIARELSAMEKIVKAQLDGTPIEDAVQESERKVPMGYQVVRAELFSHTFEPVVRFTKRTITYNSSCIAKLNRVYEVSDGFKVTRCEYVEMLLNPVERMLAVRPCDASHPNAIKWTDKKGKGVCLGATAFCSMLFDMLSWDMDYSFRVPANILTKNGKSIILFDLDNYIGNVTSKAKSKTEIPPDNATINVIADVQEDTTGIFYAADDGEPQEVSDIQEMEERFHHLAEIEKKSYGTPAFEHNSDIQLPETDEEDENDFSAEAIPLDVDHSIDSDVVEALHSKLMEEMFASANDPPKDGESGR